MPVAGVMMAPTRRLSRRKTLPRISLSVWSSTPSLRPDSMRKRISSAAEASAEPLLGNRSRMRSETQETIHTRGRDRRSSHTTVPARATAVASGLARARRLGTTSPKTRVKKVITVTTPPRARP